MDGSKLHFYLCVLTFYFIFVHLYFSSALTSAVSLSELQAMTYLLKYGYMPESSSNSECLVSKRAVSLAIRDFQRFAGLAETGMLDYMTVKMMNMPRCGVRDKLSLTENLTTRMIVLNRGQLNMTDLTYRISKYPPKLHDRSKVDEEIAKAFKIWSDVTNLKFIKRDRGRVYIDVRFEEDDGPDRTLARSFISLYSVNASFDAEEKWTINQLDGINLFQVAAHVFGHFLGLSHSDVKESLMSPFYRGYKTNFYLNEHNILHIQKLYGLPPGPPDVCQDASIDAATTTADKRTYVFKGDYYWEIMPMGIPGRYPRKISDNWSGLPDNLDAALTWTNGKTFFFKNDQYWRFSNKEADPGYPKEISVGFEGIPNNIDAAFVWSGNGKTYFFKGSNYWKYGDMSEKPISFYYPQAISNWEGLPDNIDAAFQWTNQKTYFFKGKVYYRFLDRNFSVHRGGFPRPTAVWWFDCRALS